MIIPGYNGIMDLDLTNINPVFYKELINQHLKDIENYKIEKYNLKPELRYENTIQAVLEKKIKYDKIIKKRLNF